MIKKIIISIFMCHTLVTTTFADTCPTLKEIKANQFRGWNAYTNDNGTPLGEEEMTLFKQDIGRFDSARWIDGAIEGEAHCYYDDKDGDDSRAFLSKAELVPDESSGYWKVVSGDPVCDASEAGCRFKAAE